ncbi:hypothetical protein E4T56_gene11418 [Termitomyces sp. T112]|nr:hypothetical protein E4T56_gene11418 [Termitomyces sp. T112]
MFFGLTNSPATFQTMMNDIFRDLIVEGVICVYLDNILIYTRTQEEHSQVTCMVLECLCQHQLYLKPEKCKFKQTKVEYLSLIISHGTAEMDPIKVARVAEWPEPRNKKEVQAFLGFVNFYQRFIQDFSHHARPLFDLTVKDTAWWWEPPQQAAFDALKHSVTSKPVLLFPNNDSPFRVEADSSDFATGAVLSQQSKEDGKWHPVAFYSKSLNAVERNYEIHDKEMLAIIWSFEEWRHFLEGARHKFEVWTDHKNLEYFCSAKKLNRCQARWSLYLANFDFSLHHKPGQSMGKPDALSRRADHGTGAGDNDNIVLLKPELFAICALEGIGAQEDAVAQAAQALQARQASGVKLVHADEWGLQDGLLTFRGSIYVPNIPELRLRQLHPVFNVVKLFPAPEDPIPGRRPKPPPPPVLVNDEEEYEVEEILDSRVFRGKLQFKVKWKRDGIEDISWEPQANVHAPGLVWNFYHRHPNAPKAIRGIYSISPADQAIRDFFYPVHQGAAS